MSVYPSYGCRIFNTKKLCLNMTKTIKENAYTYNCTVCTDFLSTTNICYEYI